MPLIRTESFQATFVYTKSYSFMDMRGQEIGFQLAMVENQQDSARFVLLRFFQRKRAIPAPAGIVITNNLSERALYNAAFAEPETGITAITLDEGFRILYLGQTLVTAPPNMQTMEQVVQDEFRKAE